MALVVESGSGSATADSYISSTDASTYLADYYGAAEALSAMADSEAKDAIFRRACAYIDTVYGERFAGVRNTAAQALCWPRTGATGPGGFEIDSDAIPVALGRAQAEVARRIKAGTDPRPDLERGGMVASETVDVISVEYFPGADPQTRFPQVEDLLAPLLRSGGSRFVVEVSRG